MVFNNSILLGAAGQGGVVPFDTTLIGNSVWLNGSDEDINRTGFTLSSDGQKEFIISMWVNLCELGRAQQLFILGNATGIASFNDMTQCTFNANNTIGFSVATGGSSGGGITTTRVFRDTGWYHLLFTFNSNTSVSPTTSRIQLYVNGELQTGSLTAVPDNQDVRGSLTGNADLRFGRNTHPSLGYFYKGYYGQVCYLEGKSIQASDFAVSDFLDTFTMGTNGSQVIPKKNSEIAALATSAGGNSACLDFANSSDLGNDISDNNKDFTATNMASANQSIHTPSNVYPKISEIGRPSGGTAANYSMSRGSNRMTYSGSNQVAKGLVSDKVIQADDPKIYWEFYVEAGSLGGSSGGLLGNGIVIPQFNMKTSFNANGFYGAGGESAYFQRDVMYDNGSASVSGLTPVAVGGIQQMAFEPSTGKVWIGQDGTWRNGSATASTTLNIDNHDDQLTVQDYIFVIGLQRSGDIGVINFGDNPTFSGNETAGTNADGNGHGLFKYAVPATFLAPCSANLTGPENQGVDYFQPVKYTGNGTAIGSGGNAVTGIGFSPSWVWIKNRDASDSHALYDVVRGTTKQVETDTTAVETTEAEGLSTFGTDGFTVGSLAEVNTSSEDYISWNWKAGTAFSNDASETSIGTLDSSGRVSDADHFSIVSWTGNTTAGATVKHGMAGEPEFIIAIARNQSGENKPVYHLLMTADTDHLKINEANAQGTAGTTIWDVSAMSSTLIGLGAAAQSNSTNGMIAYCFRSVPGVCKVGSYIGNGDPTVPPYVHLGFRPRFVMFKNVTVAKDWVITDTARSPSNPAELFLFPNEEEAEAARGPASGSDYDIDLLAEGFRPLTGDSAPNGNGNTIVYMAMADIGGNGILPPIYGR